jgi:hypothetical protein
MGLWNNLIVRIRGDATDLDNTFAKSESKISSFASRAGGMLKGLFAVSAIVSFGKAVIGASEALSDKFSFAVAGAKGGLREFFNLVGQADISNFFNRIGDAYTKAKDLAAAFDDLKDRGAYVSYVTSGKKEEAAKMEEIVRDKTGKYTLDARKKEAEKLKALEAEILGITTGAIAATFRLEKQGWENINKMSADEGVKLYETVASFTDEETKKISDAFKVATKEWGAKVSDPRVANTVMRMTGFSRASVEEFQRYLQLMKDGEEDVIPKLFAIFQRSAEGKTAAQDRFNGILRITNELLKEQEQGIIRVSSQSIKINPFSGKFANPITGELAKPNTPVPSQIAGNQKYIMNLGFDKSQAEDIWNQWVNGWKNAGDEITNYLEDSFISVFEAIGSGNYDNLGKNLLSGFGRLVANLGKMLVSLGTTMLLSLTLLKVPTIPTAIAAIATGAAAMAIGGLMMGAASRGAESLSSGGGSSSSSGGSISAGQMRIIVEGRIDGRDIYISNKRYSLESDRST